MHAQPSRPPYLFFSPKCPHCQQLIEMIKRTQSLVRSIEPINVHTAKSLPPQLDGVPAILFNGQLLVGPDTFRWVQMASVSEQNKSKERQQGGTQDGTRGGGMGGGGMGGGGGGDMPGMQGRQQDESGQIPMPSGISSATKHGIDYTPLPGQEFVKIDPTLPRFSYLSGEGTQSNGTDGIDYVAAMDVNSMRNNKADGVAQQLERLQQMRGMDSDKMREQADTNMMYSQGGQGGQGGQSGMDMRGMGSSGMNQQGPGFAGPMGSPAGGMSSQMNQGMGQQGGYNQGMGQQGGQNPYELQAGARGGYSTQYQQQNNQYKSEDSLPKRW